MYKAINSFFASESGAVTVDWVVLTAALVAVGVAVIGVVSFGYNDVANATADEMQTQSTTVGDHPFARAGG